MLLQIYGNNNFWKASSLLAERFGVVHHINVKEFSSMEQGKLHGHMTPAIFEIMEDLFSTAKVEAFFLQAKWSLMIME